MFKNHPKGLVVAFFANMGERFGFYTMMAILVLFLQAKYDINAQSAGSIYSWFYFAIYALALLGGIIGKEMYNNHVVIYFRWRAYIKDITNNPWGCFFFRDFAKQELEKQKNLESLYTCDSYYNKIIKCR